MYGVELWLAFFQATQMISDLRLTVHFMPCTGYRFHTGQILGSEDCTVRVRKCILIKLYSIH